MNIPTAQETIAETLRIKQMDDAKYLECKVKEVLLVKKQLPKLIKKAHKKRRDYVYLSFGENARKTLPVSNFLEKLVQLGYKIDCNVWDTILYWGDERPTFSGSY